MKIIKLLGNCILELISYNFLSQECSSVLDDRKFLAFLSEFVLVIPK